MSNLAVWTGVIGAAVGGSLGIGGAVLQGRATRREGSDARDHDRIMRYWESQSSAYVQLLEYAGRVVGRTNELKDLANNPQSLDAATLERLTVIWNVDDFQSMMAQVRAFGSDEVLKALVAFNDADKRLRLAIEARASAPTTIEACDAVTRAVVPLHRQIQAELRPSESSVRPGRKRSH